MATAAFLQKLGFTINSEKPVLFPVSYTTDNTHKVFDRLFQNGNNSVWGKVTIRLHALSEYPSKLLGNNTNREQLQTIKVIVYSFRVTPYCQMYYKGIGKWKLQSRLYLVAILTAKLRGSSKKIKVVDKKKIFFAFAPIKVPPFDLTFFSDAKLEGWGRTD